MAKLKRNQLIERRDTKTQTEKKRYWKREREKKKKKKSKFMNEKMSKTTRRTNHDEYKAQQGCKTHQCDYVEAAKDLRGAADVLESRRDARGEE